MDFFYPFVFLLLGILYFIKIKRWISLIHKHKDNAREMDSTISLVDLVIAISFPFFIWYQIANVTYWIIFLKILSIVLWEYIFYLKLFYIPQLIRNYREE